MIYGVAMNCNAGKKIYRMRGKRSRLFLTLCYLLLKTVKMSSQTKQINWESILELAMPAPTTSQLLHYLKLCKPWC